MNSSVPPDDGGSHAAPLLGVITIGQSPRPDLERVFGAHAQDAEVRVRGALDGLDARAITDLARRRTEYPLLVRLGDGTTREIGMEWLHPLVERIACEFACDRARAVVVACAGDFPPCRCDVPVVLPGRVVPREVAALSPRQRVGVVTPVEGQMRSAGAKWLADGFLPVVTWASPTHHHEIVRASAEMRDADVDLVVLDCMGHDARYAGEFAARSGKQVVTAQEIAARAAGALMNLR